MLTKKKEEHDAQGKGSARRPPHFLLLGLAAVGPRASCPCGCVGAGALVVFVWVCGVEAKSAKRQWDVNAGYGSK